MQIYTKNLKCTYRNEENVLKIKVIIDSEAKNLVGLFSKCNAIKEIEIIRFFRKKMTNLSEFFSGCQSLTILNFPEFIITNINDMSKMFNGCSNLKKLMINFRKKIHLSK